MNEFVERLGCDEKQLRNNHLSADYIRFPFSSKRKRMSTICENIEDTGNSYKKRLYTKGGSEIILEGCSHFLD